MAFNKRDSTDKTCRKILFKFIFCRHAVFIPYVSRLLCCMARQNFQLAFQPSLLRRDQLPALA